MIAKVKIKIDRCAAGICPACHYRADLDIDRCAFVGDLIAYQDLGEHCLCFPSFCPLKTSSDRNEEYEYDASEDWVQNIKQKRKTI